MKFREYVDVYGYPDKVICFDTTYRYQTIDSSYYDVPVVSGMKVDHVELTEAYPDRTVVFLRCPELRG